MITVPGLRRVDADGTVDGADPLYAPLEERFRPFPLKLIPYYAFANRGETDMLVFLNYR